MNFPIFDNDDDNSSGYEERKYKNSRQQRGREPWHLDKKVPITLIITLIVQTFVFIWGAAGFYYRVSDHERRIDLIENYDLNMDAQFKIVSDHLARLEQKTTDEIDTLNRIEGYLHRGK